MGQIGEGMLGVWKRGEKVGSGEARDGGEGVGRVERRGLGRGERRERGVEHWLCGCGGGTGVLWPVWLWLCGLWVDHVRWLVRAG